MSNNNQNPIKNKDNRDNPFYEDSFKNQLGNVSQKLNKESGDSNFQKYAAIAIVAFLIGFGIGRLDINKSKTVVQDTATSTSVMIGEDSNTNLVGVSGQQNLTAKDILEVEDQTPGFAVAIKNIHTAKSVWLAIHEDNGKGKPGNILGAQLFDPSMVSGSVQLLRATEPNKTYYAIIHDDNGDRAFIPKMDTPILDANGNPLMITFKTINVNESASTSPAL